MSGLVLFIVAAVIAYVVALLWSAVRPARPRVLQPWVKAWADLRILLNAEEPRTTEPEPLRGTLNTWPVTLTRLANDEALMTVELGGRVLPSVNLRKDSLVSFLARVPDVEIGDATFDAVALIQCDPTLMTALFDKTTVALFEPWLKTHHLTVQNGGLSVRLSAAQWASTAALVHLTEVVRLAECLEARTHLLATTLAERFLGDPAGKDASATLKTLQQHFESDPLTARCMAAASLSRSYKVRKSVADENTLTQDLCAQFVRDSRCHVDLRLDALRRLDAGTQQTLATWLSEDSSLLPEHRLQALTYAPKDTKAARLTEFVLGEQFEPELRADALSLLDRLMTPTRFNEVMLRALESPTAALNAEAVRIAGARDARSLRRAVAPLVLSSSAAVAVQAATVLGQWADPADEEMLVRCIERRSLGNAPGADDVLCAAATALGNLGTLAAVAHLKELSTKVIASTNTRNAALASIRAIQNRAGPVDAGRVSLMPSPVDEGAVSVATDVGAVALATDKDKVPS